jgi:hypothetical protein
MASYNGDKVAGRTVYRRRMGQTRYPELGRSTQLPHQRAKCQEQKNLSIEYKPLRVSCACGAAFQVIRELRQTYRKQACLSGTYCQAEAPYKARQTYIENVSRGGVALHVTSLCDLWLHDGLKVTFELNDPGGSQVNAYGYIRYIQKHTVGVQFAADCMQPYCKALGFYLMSA